MPRRVPAQSSSSPVVHTTTTLEMPPSAAPDKKEESGPDFWTYMQTCEGSTVPWRNHIVYLTRELPKTSINGLGGGYLTKITQPFDMEDIKQTYGGYEFSYIMKKDDKIAYSGRFRVEAQPKLDPAREATPGVPAAPAANSTTEPALLRMLEEQIREMREEMRQMRLQGQGQNGGSDRVIEVMADGAKRAMEIVTSQVPKANSTASEMKEMVLALKELGILGGGATQQKSLLEQLGELIANPSSGRSSANLLRRSIRWRSSRNSVRWRTCWKNSEAAAASRATGRRS
jgi:hypothetical protein